MSPNRRSSLRGLAWLLAMSLLLALAAGAAAAENGVLERASGAVEVGRGEPPRWQAAAGGEALAPGDRVRTGRDGRAELVWQGATIRLYGDSMLRLPTASWRARASGVELEEGAGLFDVERREDGSFEVQTPHVVVSVKGTRFGVGVGAGPAEVWVYRGSVGVRALALESAREVMVREGFRAVGDGDHEPEVFLLDHRDPWSDWLDHAPPRSHAAAPARQADDSARESVRKAAQGRALALTLERNPRLAARFAEMRAQLAAEADREADPGGDANDTLDPVLDATSDDVERTLESRFIEEVLNVSDDSLGVRLSSAGTIEISDTKLDQSWNLDPQTLTAILDGTAPMPTGLDAALADSGVTDPTEALALMLGVLQN